MIQVSIQSDYDEGPEVYDVTYTAGSVTGVVHTDKREPANIETFNISVNPSDIDNKCNLCQFETLYHIDLDGATVADMAGLLGKRPVKFPAKAVYEGDSTYDYTWTLDGNGYPASLKTVGTSEYSTYTSEDIYTWGSNAGIDNIAVDSAATEGIYGLDGLRRDALQHGLNIVRRADGSVSKVMVK